MFDINIIKILSKKILKVFIIKRNEVIIKETILLNIILLLELKEIYKD